MNRIEVLSATVSGGLTTTTARATVGTASNIIPRSVVLPWAAWTLLAVFIVRSEFRQWVTRTVSSSLETLRCAAVLGDPVPHSELEKIERRWLWSFLVWKSVY